MDIQKFGIIPNRMKELEPRKYTDTFDAFTDLLGNALQVALNWQFIDDEIQVRSMREVFYEKVQRFRDLGLPSQGNVTPEALESFDQFREVDWAQKGRLDTIVSHYYTIIPRVHE